MSVEQDVAVRFRSKPCVAECGGAWNRALDDMARAGLDVSEQRSMVNGGIRLKVVAEPPVAEFTNTHTLRAHQAMAVERVRDYRALGAVEVLSGRPVVVQPLHVVVKADRKPRLVLDLSRNFNDFIQDEPLVYEDLTAAMDLVFPKCYFGKHDLADCYLSFPVHESSRKWLAFELAGKYYRFTRLPFGLKTAPRSCTMLLDIVSWVLRSRGVRHVRYLDDFLYVGATAEEVRRNMRVAERVFYEFGLAVNVKKTVEACQKITFLGIELDSMACTLQCTPERLKEIADLCDTAIAAGRLTQRALQSLVGKFSFAAQVLPGARAFMRRLLARLDGLAAPHHVVWLRSYEKDDLRFWRAYLSVWNGRRQWVTGPPSVVVATDASLEGFGGVVELDSNDGYVNMCGAAWMGMWAAEHHALTDRAGQMVWAELYSAVFAISRIAKVYSGRVVRLIMDSATNVEIINSWSTRSHAVSALLRQLSKCVADSNLVLIAEHRAGVLNHWPDLLSRPAKHRFRPLTALRADKCIPRVRAGDVLSIQLVRSSEMPVGVRC